ncbi:MAG: DinB family protein [Acidobacteriia bacterium]|nr:DinB family protein [Terriglobia bacterium]
MLRILLSVSAAALAGACLLPAQSASSAAEVKQAYNNVKRNITAAADKVSDADYNFKATPDVRTFGQLIGHVADSQLRGCSALNGEMKQPSAGSKTEKADLVAALKDSFAECDKAFDALTDANANEAVSAGRGQRTRLGALYGQVVHDNEMYGYMSVYMRLKGVVPPSSEPRGRGR